MPEQLLGSADGNQPAFFTTQDRNAPACLVFHRRCCFCIEMVQPLDSPHALDIARAQHSTGGLSAVPAEMLDDQDRYELHAAWLKGEG